MINLIRLDENLSLYATLQNFDSNFATIQDSINSLLNNFSMTNNKLSLSNISGLDIKNDLGINVEGLRTNTSAIIEGNLSVGGKVKIQGDCDLRSNLFLPSGNILQSQEESYASFMNLKVNKVFKLKEHIFYPNNVDGLFNSNISYSKVKPDTSLLVVVWENDLSPLGVMINDVGLETGFLLNVVFFVGDGLETDKYLIPNFAYPDKGNNDIFKVKNYSTASFVYLSNQFIMLNSNGLEKITL